MGQLDDDAYTRLLALRTGLRQFERWSAHQAEDAGLTPAQHQLLLAIRGHSDRRGPTVGEVADYLLLQHHSAVGLVDRAEAAGLVSRTRGDDDRRVVRLQLTPTGARRLEALSALHLEELDRLVLELPKAWAGLTTPGRAPAGESPQGKGRVGVARVYDPPEAARGGRRVLVDRLWPRGISKADPPFDEWMKDVAPSAELRKWYGHVPERFDEFARRYRDELSRTQDPDELRQLQTVARSQPLVLMTATKDVAHSGAQVLAEVIRGGKPR